MCAERAKIASDEWYPHEKNDLGFEYTSHFDSKVNICYLLVHSMTVSKGDSTESEIVVDAYEGREYASYIWINTEKKNYWEVAPTDCHVKPRSDEPITCHSYDEFGALIDRYFGIGR
jgi:hypothetical protein